MSRNISVVLVFLLIICVVGIAVLSKRSFTNNKDTMVNRDQKNGETAYLFDKEECTKAVEEQLAYLNSEVLADTETFDAYPVAETFTESPAELDVVGNPLVELFRTRLRELYAKEEINFAGHYSIIFFGMTGRGLNHFIVDGKTGTVFSLPYKIESPDLVQFSPKSNLLIINPRDVLLEKIHERRAKEENCYILQGSPSRYFTDLRPFYFLWEDNELKKIGPEHLEPFINNFEEEYQFGGE